MTSEATIAQTLADDLADTRAKQASYEQIAEELHDDFVAECDTDAGPALRDRAHKAATVARAYEGVANAIAALIEAGES